MKEPNFVMPTMDATNVIYVFMHKNMFLKCF